MKTNILIIGQGLSGSWLSYYLGKAGIDFLVMDDAQPNTASKTASGIINPVTGRRLVKTWLIDEVMPFAVDAYQQFELAPASIISQTMVLDFFSAADVEVRFNERLAENADYLTRIQDAETWRKYFDFQLGVGGISPCFVVDVPAFVNGWQQHLLANNLLIQAAYNEAALVMHKDGIVYKNITAQKIIYTNGIHAATSKYFNRLPFAANKGEALIAAIPNLPPHCIYKKGLSLVPWQPGLYWLGSNYLWHFTDALPSAAFKKMATDWLSAFCKMPFEIVNHIAAIRPATLERRPFVGFHPSHNQLGILNGMGSKGVSLAPFFAQQLAQHLAGQGGIMPEVAISRFLKLLTYER